MAAGYYINLLTLQAASSKSDVASSSKKFSMFAQGPNGMQSNISLLTFHGPLSQNQCLCASILYAIFLPIGIQQQSAASRSSASKSSFAESHIGGAHPGVIIPYGIKQAMPLYVNDAGGMLYPRTGLIYGPGSHIGGLYGAGGTLYRP